MEARVSKIDSDIAAIQLDVREFRTDMKAAYESIAYLRTAVATIDGKINALGEKVEAGARATDAKLTALNDKLDASVNAIEATVAGSSEATDARFITFYTKFAALNDKLDTHIKSTESRFDKIDARFDLLSAKLVEVTKGLDEKITALGVDVAKLQGSMLSIVVGIAVVALRFSVGRWAAETLCQ